MMHDAHDTHFCRYLKSVQCPMPVIEPTPPETLCSILIRVFWSKFLAFNSSIVSGIEIQLAKYYALLLLVWKDLQEKTHMPEINVLFLDLMIVWREERVL